MDINPPSPKLESAMNIFRPWQINSSVDDSNKEVQSSHTVNYCKSFEVASTSNEKHDLQAENYLTNLVEESSLELKLNTKITKQEIIPENYSVSLSESLVTSSTSINENISNVKNLEMPQHKKGQKRKIEEFNENSYKRSKSEVVKPSFVIPSPSSSYPVTSTANILQGIPPTGAPLHSTSAFLPANPFGSYVPLLEPPIFVPVSEVERVCARRPRPKRFSCNECGAAFSNRGQLSGHCRIHTGERPFRCTQPECGKKFTRNEELTRHRRIHSGLRPFACGVCPKRFGRKDHLKKHLRTHTRHVLPHFPPLQTFEHLQHLQQFQHLQHLQHLQQLQQLQFQIPLMPVPMERKAL